MKCKKCWSDDMQCNSGEVGQQGYIDCQCGAAEDRATFNASVIESGLHRLTTHDRYFAIHQRAVAQERAKADQKIAALREKLFKSENAVATIRQQSILASIETNELREELAKAKQQSERDRSDAIRYRYFIENKDIAAMKVAG